LKDFEPIPLLVCMTPWGGSMEFRILGTLQVSHAGSLLAIGGPRHRTLLTVLLVSANEVISAGRLIESLWGEESPKSAPAMLHVRVCELRAALRAGRPEHSAGLLTRGGGYLLQVGADELDARRFERLAASGRQAMARADYESASASLREALALWRGPALVEVAERAFAQAEVARLEALRLQALEDRLEADLALGRHDDVIPELGGLVADHPLRERLWRQLMLALYRAGRQGEALGTYQAVRELLVDRMGIDPGVELQRLQAAILRQDPELELRAVASGAQRREPPNNLPAALTSFIGRERELAEIRALLQTNRLATVTGAGGVGKSRLALEVAATCLLNHPDGTWLIELAELVQPGLLVHHIAATIGMREHPHRPLIEVLGEYLRNADVLLILDNCEHLVDEVAELADRLLRECPRLRILATSQERLGITGEALRSVVGLTVPLPGVTSVSAVGHAAAVRLFVERAAAVQGDFSLFDATAAAVAQICQRLDGVPLAIELAAARVNALGVTHITARLDDQFRLLTRGGRPGSRPYQTLRAVFGWSYGLLSKSQRRLFDQLAVFVGGFTLEAAEAVSTGPAGIETVVGLACLVDKSLVTTETTGDASRRYRILETLRGYGLECLEERGEFGRQYDHHAAFFLALAESAGEALRGPEQSAWLQRLETEHGNIRAALEWSLRRGDIEMAARLAGSLYPFWDLHGYYTEGSMWLARVLAAHGPVPPALRVRALLGAATLAVIQGNLDDAAANCEQAVALCKQIGNLAGLAHALQYLGFIAIYMEDYDHAAELLDDSLCSARAANEPWLEGWSLVFLATAALASADYERAAWLSTECEAVLQPVGDLEGLGWALAIRGAAAWRNGEHTAAAQALGESLRAFQGLGGVWGLSVGLLFTALLEGRRGADQRVIALLGASEGLRESIGAGLLPFVKTWLDSAVTEARTAVGIDDFGRAWRAGQVMATEAAVTEAIRELDLAARSIG
jgi:predicted ATPase/DNA-binding SARP family transcriptional activator